MFAAISRRLNIFCAASSAASLVDTQITLEQCRAGYLPQMHAGSGSAGNLAAQIDCSSCVGILQCSEWCGKRDGRNRLQLWGAEVSRRYLTSGTQSARASYGGASSAAYWGSNEGSRRDTARVARTSSWWTSPRGQSTALTACYDMHLFRVATALQL